jgi:signal transduction histidine kinase
MFAARLTASPTLAVLIAALALAIFVIDSMTDQGIAIAVFYVVVVFLSVLRTGARGVLLVSGGCMALTLLSYALWPRGPSGAGMLDTIISLVAIGVTSYFALKIRGAEAARQEARNQLARISRLTTLAELAASIAHEVNQPLAAIASNADAGCHWLAREPADVTEARKALGRIASDAMRAGTVIDKIRRLATKEPAHRALIDLNDSALEILAVTQGELDRHRIALRAEMAPGLPPVLGDRVQIGQVILNLVVNAIDAMSGDDGGARTLRVATSVDRAGRIGLTVSDSGKGLDAAELDHIFDPFRGSKPNGLGLGLTICRSIIEAHGGRIAATPAEDGGARFEFFLPPARKPGPPAAGAAALSDAAATAG